MRKKDDEDSKDRKEGTTKKEEKDTPLIYNPYPSIPMPTPGGGHPFQQFSSNTPPPWASNPRPGGHSQTHMGPPGPGNIPLPPTPPAYLSLGTAHGGRGSPLSPGPGSLGMGNFGVPGAGRGNLGMRFENGGSASGTSLLNTNGGYNFPPQPPHMAGGVGRGLLGAPEKGLGIPPPPQPSFMLGRGRPPPPPLFGGPF